MIETAFLGLFIYVFGWSCGRAHRDWQMSLGIKVAAGEQVSSPWYGPQVLAGRIHADQDVVGDMPPLAKEIRFGPPEPRWWMRYVTRRAG